MMNKSIRKSIGESLFPTACPNCGDTTHTGLVVDVRLELVAHCTEIDDAIEIELSGNDWANSQIVQLECGNCGEVLL